ncbi:MAG: hypothetical protein AAF718_02745 [Pseudomonadota bacterium]
MRGVLLGLCLSIIPTVAPAWLAENGLIVRQKGSGFEVPYRGLTGARDFWCAAGDYVIRELEMPPDTRIYRTSKPPRRAGQGVRFSLRAEGATRTGLLVWSEGRGLTASFAREFCQTQRIESQ